MSGRNGWLIAYYALFAGILATGALNMLHVRGGFFTNHAADVVVPAWLYVAARGLHSAHGPRTFIQRIIGQTPEFAALSLFAASAVTEASQLYWPRGVFPGRFDVPRLGRLCRRPRGVLRSRQALAAHFGDPRTRHSAAGCITTKTSSQRLLVALSRDKESGCTQHPRPVSRAEVGAARRGRPREASLAVREAGALSIPASRHTTRSASGVEREWVGQTETAACEGDHGGLARGRMATTIRRPT